MVYFLHFQRRGKGGELFDKICESLNIMEKDYFGITYRDAEDARVSLIIITFSLVSELI